jgi:hypothetical protein
MTAFSGIKRILGYFPRAAWRQAWRRLRRQTIPAVRRRLSSCAGFAIRSPKGSFLQSPPGPDPAMEAATRQCWQQAQERFLSGRDLEPLTALAEKGIVFRIRVSEQIANTTGRIHALSVYPTGFHRSENP